MPRSTLSCRIHNRLFADTHESLCSRAWRLQNRSLFWLVWVWLFGARHCERSWHWYWIDLRLELYSHRQLSSYLAISQC